jgi:hypothetical protein
MSNLNATQPAFNAIGQAAGVEHQAQMLGMQSSLSQANNSYNMLALEANGVEAQFAIQQISTQENITSDLLGLGTKNALLFAGKTLETYTLIAQTREKTLGLFTSIIQARSQTSWNNMKQMVQGFKF